MRNLTRILMYSLLICSTFHSPARAADGDPTSAPAKDAIKKFEDDKAGVEKDLAKLREAARDQYRADLQKALAAALKAAELPASNWTKAEIKRLEGNEGPGAAPPNFEPDVSARKRYDRSVAKADADAIKSFEPVRKQCISSLTAAKKNALAVLKDVDEANRINVAIEKTKGIELSVANGAKPEAEWVDLFNGKSLKGWAPAAGSKGVDWTVRDGVLIGTGQLGHLMTTRDDYANFHLRVEALISKGGNSGIFFRICKPVPGDGSYQAQISDSTDGDTMKTGSLRYYSSDQPHYRTPVLLKESPVAPAKWFTTEVIADGPHIIILVDGKKTADFVETVNVPAKGAISLECYHCAPIQFRRVQIRELPATKPATAAH